MPHFSISASTHLYIAASVQGGKGTSICIPGWQNSFQGGKLSRLKAKVGKGNDYVVVVTGWDCESGTPLAGESTNCAAKTKRDKIPGYRLSEGLLFRFLSLSTLLTATPREPFRKFHGQWAECLDAVFGGCRSRTVSTVREPAGAEICIDLE